MKKILLSLVAIIAFVACSDNDKPEPPNITAHSNSQLSQTLYADNTKGKSEVSFSTSGGWTSAIQETTPVRDAAITTPSWISINPPSGDKAGDYTINIILSANYTGKDRTATININCNGESIQITVKQEAKTEEGKIPSGTGAFTNTKTNKTVNIAKAAHYISSKDMVRLEFYKDETTSGSFFVDMRNPLSNGRLAAGTYKHGQEKNGEFYWIKSELGGYSSGGTITVAITENLYTISLDIETEDKEKITGTYTGVLEYLNEEIKVSEITLNKSEITLEIGKYATLSATVLPENALNKDLTWSSSDPKIATVSQGGEILALAAGNTIVTATTEDGNKTASSTVTVKPFEATGAGTFTNTKTNKTVNIAKAAHYISSKDMVRLEFYKDETTSGSFSVDMRNPLSNGRLVAGTYKHGQEKNGEFYWIKSELGGYSSGGTITVAISGDTYTISLDIEIEDKEKITGTYTGVLEYLNEEIKVTGITLSKNTLTLDVGETGSLNATILPENALNKSFTWSSSNLEIATVSETGNVQAIAAGTAIITATTEDGNKTALCNITVKALETTGSGKITYTYNNAHIDVTRVLAGEAYLAFYQGAFYQEGAFYSDFVLSGLAFTNGKLAAGTYTFSEKGGANTFYLSKGGMGKDTYCPVGGTVTISVSGETYTITLNIDTVTDFGSKEGNNPAKITGTYTGKIQYYK